MGERDEARRLFENVLSSPQPACLLAEHVDPKTREQWGNFVQTYSMAGIISSRSGLLDARHSAPHIRWRRTVGGSYRLAPQLVRRR
jgi:GH15 family glucan-1,4-alpha-glucosidase